MRDVTRKVGLVAQWYGARIVTQMDGGSSLGAGVTFFLNLFSFFQCFLFCFVLFSLFVCLFFIKIKKCRHF